MALEKLQQFGERLYQANNLYCGYQAKGTDERESAISFREAIFDAFFGENSYRNFTWANCTSPNIKEKFTAFKGDGEGWMKAAFNVAHAAAKVLVATPLFASHVAIDGISYVGSSASSVAFAGWGKVKEAATWVQSKLQSTPHPTTKI